MPKTKLGKDTHNRLMTRTNNKARIIKKNLLGQRNHCTIKKTVYYRSFKDLLKNYNSWTRKHRNIKPAPKYEEEIVLNKRRNSI